MGGERKTICITCRICGGPWVTEGGHACDTTGPRWNGYYTGHLDGVAAERARIVAGMRERAEKIRQAAHAGPLAALDIGEAIADAIDTEADRIERGE